MSILIGLWIGEYHMPLRWIWSCTLVDIWATYVNRERLSLTETHRVMWERTNLHLFEGHIYRHLWVTSCFIERNPYVYVWTGVTNTNKNHSYRLSCLSSLITPHDHTTTIKQADCPRIRHQFKWSQSRWYSTNQYLVKQKRDPKQGFLTSWSSKKDSIRLWSTWINGIDYQRQRSHARLKKEKKNFHKRARSKILLTSTLYMTYGSWQSGIHMMPFMPSSIATRLK